MENSNIVVFGGSGFIGSHVVDGLLEQDYQVINVDIKEYYPESHQDFYLYMKRNIVYDEIKTIFKRYDPGIVFNFVSIHVHEECNNNPILSYRTNIKSNLKILDAMVNCDIKPLYIYASTVYVHSRNGGLYGITKRCAEDTIRFFSEFYDIPHIILRYGTVYGPRANKENSVRRLIESALETKIVSYYGTGEEVREYIHVKDAANKSIELMDRGFNQTFTLTGPHSTKSKDLVVMIKEILGDEYNYEFRNEVTPDHYVTTPYNYIPDIARKYSGEMNYDLGAGLLSLIREIKENEER